MDPRVIELVSRIRSYPVWVVAVELAVLWLIVYIILRFLRGTRGARVIKGTALVMIIATMIVQVFGGDVFERLNTLYSNFLEVLTLALIIIFQPELRRALVRLGEARLFWSGDLRKARVIEELLGSIEYLSRNKIGALVALERTVGLGGVVEAGTRLDAAVSKELLDTIFWPGSVLHDMGVVIRGDRVVAAGVQFPLAEGDVSQELGSRHRAAIGLSQETDALVAVVSEETGIISLAERGELTRHLSIEDLRKHLVRGMGKMALPPEAEHDLDRERERELEAERKTQTGSPG